MLTELLGAAIMCSLYPDSDDDWYDDDGWY